MLRSVNYLGLPKFASISPPFLPGWAFTSTIMKSGPAITPFAYVGYNENLPNDNQQDNFEDRFFPLTVYITHQDKAQAFESCSPKEWWKLMADNMFKSGQMKAS